MWFDTSFNMNRYQCGHRLNLNRINMNSSSLPRAAEFKCLEYSNLKLNANTLNWMWQLLKLTNLQTITAHFSPIHIQMSFGLDWALSAWTSGSNFCSLSDGRQLPPRRLPTVGWHSSLSQLQALWHGASSAPQPMNKPSSHLVKGMQIASNSSIYCDEQNTLCVVCLRYKTCIQVHLLRVVRKGAWVHSYMFIQQQLTLKAFQMCRPILDDLCCTSLHAIFSQSFPVKPLICCSQTYNEETLVVTFVSRRIIIGWEDE